MFFQLSCVCCVESYGCESVGLLVLENEDGGDGEWGEVLHDAEREKEERVLSIVTFLSVNIIYEVQEAKIRDAGNNCPS